MGDPSGWNCDNMALIPYDYVLVANSKYVYYILYVYIHRKDICEITLIYTTYIICKKLKQLV